MSSAEQPIPGVAETTALAEIERSEQEGVRVVAVVGEVDVSNVGALEGAAQGLSNEALGVVVDLSRATYIDSATIGVLFRLRRRLDRRGQVLRVICAPGSNAWRVLELTGFDRQMHPEEDRDAAIAAIHEAVPLNDGIALVNEQAREGEE
ncbi:MAG TPA: STAS domain-containing protein [Solirubrobacteraceae bacterium]|nr:STAS domain-containing protein [Solirubrobacteraceae bacterium]